jgi:hypothetical protein
MSSFALSYFSDPFLKAKDDDLNKLNWVALYGRRAACAKANSMLAESCRVVIFGEAPEKNTIILQRDYFGLYRIYFSSIV